MNGFLQYGYLGFLGLVIYLSHRIIVKDSNRTFAHTVILLFLFIIISVGSSGVGYLWASKEFEAAIAKKSTTTIVMEQIKSLQQMHQKDMQPLQSALDDAVHNFKISASESYRKQHREEMSYINEIIRARNNAFGSQISALKNFFEEKGQ